MIAQTPVTAPMDGLTLLMPLFQSLGIPGAIMLILAYTCKKLVQWGIPWLEKLIASWISRQMTMEECQKKLTNSTVEIQQKNATVLEAIQRDMPRVCHGFKEFSQRKEPSQQ